MFHYACERDGLLQFFHVFGPKDESGELKKAFRKIMCLLCYAELAGSDLVTAAKQHRIGTDKSNVKGCYPFIVPWKYFHQGFIEAKKQSWNQAMGARVDGAKTYSSQDGRSKGKREREEEVEGEGAGIAKFFMPRIKLNNSGVSGEDGVIDLAEGVDGAEGAPTKLRPLLSTDRYAKSSDKLPLAFATCLLVGGMPLSLFDNEGIKLLLNFFGVPTKERIGLSARTMGRIIAEDGGLFDTWQQARIAKISSLAARITKASKAPDGSSLPGTNMYSVAGTHDSWPSKFAKKRSNYFGVKLYVMDIGVSPWVIASSVAHFGASAVKDDETRVVSLDKSAAAASSLIKDTVLKRFKLRISHISSMTSDTTLSALNVLQEELPGEDRVACWAHRTQLFLKWSMSGFEWDTSGSKFVLTREGTTPGLFESVTEAVHAVCVKVRSSEKTLILLHEALKSKGEPELSPKLKVASRFNSLLGELERLLL